MSNFGSKLEHLLSTRAEIISRMHRPPPAEGNDTDPLTGEFRKCEFDTQVPQVNIPVWPDEKAAAFCAVLPPIETFMLVPDEIRREQFFATARQDDILIGIISAIQDSGLIITLLCYDQGPRRDLEGLKMTGFCPVRQLPRYAAHGNPLDAFQIGDKVRTFILDVHPAGRLILSMIPKGINRDLFGDIKLGIISDDDLPLHYKKLQNLESKSFEDCLDATPQFQNPDGLRILCTRFGIPRASNCSLLLSLSKIKMPKSELACELRRTQLYNLSMKHVAQGVKYFKAGQNTEALQCYNFAIEVENTNQDAFVARGALYASVGSYIKAIEDLERSLKLAPNHANAKNYLGQTLVAFAGELTRKDPGRAEQLLRRALKLDPDNEEARQAMSQLPPGYGEDDVEQDEEKAAGLRAWSHSPSPVNRSSLCSHSARSPGSEGTQGLYNLNRGGAGAGNGPGTGTLRPVNPVASHMERSRAALEQLVEQDRNRRRVKESERQHQPQPVSNSRRESPVGFYSPEQNKGSADRYRDEKKSEKGAGSNRDDMPKIVITRNQSGRVIRCDDEDETRFDARRGPDSDDTAMFRRGREEDEDQRRQARRIFDSENSNENAPPNKFETESDLPLTSNILQERVQERLRAIERRHQIENVQAGTCLPNTLGFGDNPSHAQHGSAGVAIPPPGSDEYGSTGGMRSGGEWRWSRGRGQGGYFEDRGRGWMDRGPRGSGGRGPGRGGQIRWGRGSWEDRRMGGRGGSGGFGGGYRYDDRRRDGSGHRDRGGFGAPRFRDEHHRPGGLGSGRDRRDRSRLDSRSPKSRSRSPPSRTSRSRSAQRSRSHSRSRSRSRSPGGRSLAPRSVPTKNTISTPSVPQSSTDTAAGLVPSRSRSRSRSLSRQRTEPGSTGKRNAHAGGTNSNTQSAITGTGARSRRHRSPTTSSSCSSSRSPSRSPSRTPPPGNKRGRVISRARVKTPPFRPLVTKAKEEEQARKDSALADVENFVAQLKAKRQLKEELAAQERAFSEMHQIMAAAAAGENMDVYSMSGDHKDDDNSLGQNSYSAILDSSVNPNGEQSDNMGRLDNQQIKSPSPMDEEVEGSDRPAQEEGESNLVEEDMAEDSD